MQDRVQLKREEVVGDGVALSDINPITNTESVDDENSGTNLAVTIDRIWSAINNKLARVVNSVNGRDGIVVLTAEDVGLGNVTNVSFSTIKDWVIEEVLSEFGLKRLALFDTYDQFTDVFNNEWINDKSRSNIPYYVKEGPTNNKKSVIGYVEWNPNESRNYAHEKTINVISEADDSIIYDEIVNGKNYIGGKIGVNIWSGEDALKLLESSGNKGLGGLYIDKGKIASDVYAFNCCYGTGNPGDQDALIYLPIGQVYPDNVKHIEIYINDQKIMDPFFGSKFTTCRDFKIHDVVITNFSDDNCREVNGALKTNINKLFVNRESCIGSITNVYEENGSTYYELKLFTIKPYVGMGLKYYENHTSDSVEGNLIGIDLMTGQGSLSNEIPEDNISGLNAFNRVERDNVEIVNEKVHHTVTPIGDKVVNKSKNYDSLFIAPDFSLNVIPYNTFNRNTNNLIKNWPIKIPKPSTGITNESFLGTNLLKRMPLAQNIAVNMSGLRIFNDTEEITNADIGKNDNDLSDKLDYPINHYTYELLSEAEAPQDWGSAADKYFYEDDGDYYEIIFTGDGTELHPWNPAYEPDRFYEKTIPSWLLPNYSTGGLAVNVGRFLEIGSYVGSEIDNDPLVPIRYKDHYYDGGKVNVRVDDMFFTDDDNRLGLKLSHYSKYEGRDENIYLGGGLVYTNGHDNVDTVITPGLTINRGMGLRMSHYDRYGRTIPPYIYTLVEGVDDGQGGLTWPGHTSTELHYYRLEGTTYIETLVYGEGTPENPYTPVFTPGMYYTRRDNVVQDNAFLGVSVVDQQYTAADIGGIESGGTATRQRQYGGLRYIVGPGPDSQSSIGLRVNSSVSPYGHELRLGEKAIGIDEQNIVGVQLYRESDQITKDINPLKIDTWNEETIYPYVKIKGLVETETYPSKDNFPSTGRTDKMYYSQEERRRYVWSTTRLAYEPMFINTTGGEPEYAGEWNKVYVRTDVDNIEHTFYGAAYKWVPQYTVRLPLSVDTRTNPVTYKDNGVLDSYIASQVLKYYALSATAYSKTSTRVDGYYWNGNFYKESSHTTMLTPQAGKVYRDLSIDKPMMFYQWFETYNMYLSVFIKNPDMGSEVERRTVTVEDILACDVNNDGNIDAIDASIILSWYSFISTIDNNPDIELRQRFQSLSTTREKFALYLELFKDVHEVDVPHYELIHQTGVDPTDGSFIPGLNISINESQGLTSNLIGDIKKAVSVKIYDRSAGYTVIDEQGKDTHVDAEGNLDYTGGSVMGGLRFYTDGFLGVRVNAADAYNATTQKGRQGSDLSRPESPTSSRTGDPLADLGGRGLMVYRNNVLGVQLTHDGQTENDYFEFDEYGSLQLKNGAGGGGGQYLTIRDSESNEVQYNGSTAINITLGPGLILEPDPVPQNPEPEPEEEQTEPGE